MTSFTILKKFNGVIRVIDEKQKVTEREKS